MYQNIRLSPKSSFATAVLPYWHWRKLWVGSTVTFALLGLFYVLALKTDTWVATQGLVVRDEASGAVMRLGRFESQTQMKAAQEMVLEMARSQQVVGQALATVGRPPRFFGLMKGDSEFSPAEIEAFGRNCVSVSAPRGAELGTTEVIYLEIKDSSKDRAVQLAAALCDSLELQLQEVRRARAEGVIQELRAALSVSESELARSTEKLKNLELQAGADLVDLRGLTESNSGSTNRLMLDLVRDDLRKAELELQLHRENLDAVQLGLSQPDLLMQITDRLVDTQPTIKKLREGLSEARLRTAQLQGRFSESHAEVVIAKVTEQRFRDNLLQELVSSEQAIQGAIAYCEMKIAKLNDQERALGKRLNLLADIRGDYTNIVSEVKSNNDEVQQIRRDLTQAMAARNAASSSSLITRVSSPQLGDRPVGPGRTTIVGGSLMGGLFFGLGVVFMLTPLGEVAPQGRLMPRSESTDGAVREKSASNSTVQSVKKSNQDRKPTQGQDSQSARPTSEALTEVEPPNEPALTDESTSDEQFADLRMKNQPAGLETVDHSGVNPATSNAPLLTSLEEWEAKFRSKLGGQSKPSEKSLEKGSKSSQSGKSRSNEEATEIEKGGRGIKPSGLEEVQAIIAKALEAQSAPSQA